MFKGLADVPDGSPAEDYLAVAMEKKIGATVEIAGRLAPASVGAFDDESLFSEEPLQAL